MTARVAKQLEILKAREYRKNRKVEQIDLTGALTPYSDTICDAMLFAEALKREEPVLMEGERMGFNRYQAVLPKLKREYDQDPKAQVIGNIAPNYGRIMSQGMGAVLDEANHCLKKCDEYQKEFYTAVILTLESALDLAERYRVFAEENGYLELAEALKQVPRYKPQSFYQACVFMKFMMFTIRCTRIIHLPIGRFDQFMLPYYEADRNKGVSQEDLLEVLEEFFISINIDTDLYPGRQQGDNGQSLVLGGTDIEGNDQFNELSALCMKASLELSLIDPKINLRVNKNTPLSLFELGTEMTKQGLGFPQYCNDDVVIKGLVNWGYDRQDAVNYVVAACWEYIIPYCAAEVPNIITMNFPAVVHKVIHRDLLSCETFEDLMNCVETEIQEECDRLILKGNARYYLPSPYVSVYVDGCLEQGKDIAHCAAKYNNFGSHGAGIANGADALAAIQKVIYQDGSLTKQDLLSALEQNFEGNEPLRHLLLDCPKMGNNEESVDEIACRLMGAFSGYLNGKPNSRGGIYRAGTGSAMEYIFSAREVPATADGRKAGEPYGSSFSPSITTRLNGPLSVIQSFTKFDLSKIVNGGPLTMEFHDTVFRNKEGCSKVAMLVKAFIDLGGHQLQLNAVNRETLLEAKKHPENYSNLIVRVWGWSGYFNELDPSYQDHIIKRTEFSI